MHVSKSLPPPLESCDRKTMATDQGNVVVVDGCLRGGADRISDLPDHLLHRILICLPSTRYAARTSVLSRRWRRVWTHLPELAFRYNISPEGVDAALAACSAPVLHRLDIALSSPEPESPHLTAEDVCSWLRFASERLAGELCLSVPSRREGVLVLPVCGRFTAISVGMPLRLRFQLRPAGGVFTALAALTIKFASIEISEELEEVVSSSRCPRLKELVLENIILQMSRDNVLSIRSNSLEKLRVANAAILLLKGVRHRRFQLHVATPELQELSLWLSSEDIDGHIVAPKLSMVCWSNSYDPRRHQVEAGRHLKRLELTSRSLALFGCFDAVDELDLDIFIPEGAEEYRRILEDTNKIIKCEALAVKILAVSHHFQPIILHLLRKCVGTRKFVVRLGGFLFPCKRSSCPCDLAHNNLIANDIVLDSLKEVVVKGGGDATAKLVSWLSRCNETFQKKVHITISE